MRKYHEKWPPTHKMVAAYLGIGESKKKTETVKLDEGENDAAIAAFLAQVNG